MVERFRLESAHGRKATPGEVLAEKTQPDEITGGDPKQK
jgi:cytochrome c oxidase subunit 1